MSRLLLILLIFSNITLYADDYKLKSPNNNLSLKISHNKQKGTVYHLQSEGIDIGYGEIDISMKDIGWLLKSSEIIDIKRSSIDKNIKAKFWRDTDIHERYNQLEIIFNNHISIQFRAYNEGMAYRFSTNYSDSIIINDEKYVFKLRDPSFEHIYTGSKYADLNDERAASNYKIDSLNSFVNKTRTWLPILAISNKTGNVVITEADLLDYPGMLLTFDSSKVFRGYFAKYPSKTKPGGLSNYNLTVLKTKDYIAYTQGTRSFPWRVIIPEKEDRKLINNNLVYMLSSPSKIKNTDWIKPGLVSWDWWSSLNLDNMNFKTGINFNTYKYYIDFASKNNIPYVNLDDGWTNTFEIDKYNPEVDFLNLVDYAEKKNVKLIVWYTWYVLDKNMEETLKTLHHLGVAGIKVDFIDRNDQLAIEFYQRCAKMCAKYKLVVNFHGILTPAGLERTYPNVLTREGVKGLEHNKFSNRPVTPEYDVMLPYARNIAGAMDYTPGAMVNVRKEDFRTSYINPVSMGTRCHQLGMYVVYFSPLQMLSDAPTAYEKEMEILHILTQIPTTWDKSIALDGSITTHAIVARKYNGDWWIGAINNWEQRDVEIPFDFLDTGKYAATLYKDGVNCNRRPTDYQIEEIEVSRESIHKIKMSSGGGCLIRITKK